MHADNAEQQKYKIFFKKMFQLVLPTFRTLILNQCLYYFVAGKVS